MKITALIALCGSVSVWLLSLLAPQVYGYMFNASPAVMELVRRYTPYFMMGTVMFFAQMTLQNVFIALNQARISIFLACLRKVILLIPLCFALPYAFGVSGVFYSEGIADIVAGVITAATFFCMLPRILKKREILARAESSGGERAGWLCRRGNKVKRAGKPPAGGFQLFLSASCEKCCVCAVRA